MCTVMERSTKCSAGIVMSPGGKPVRPAQRGSGLPVNAVRPSSPRVMPSPVTVTVTGDAPGLSTRIGIVAVSPGVSDVASGGTETAIERGPVELGAGDDAAETPSGKATKLAAI